MTVDNYAQEQCPFEVASIHLNFLLNYHLQEIYPPKLTEFAYVTDGACTEDEILDQELLILKVRPICSTFYNLKSCLY